MPFEKITEGPNAGKYRSPSGRIYTEEQVKAYYATDGWRRKARKKRKDGKQ